MNWRKTSLASIAVWQLFDGGEHCGKPYGACCKNWCTGGRACRVGRTTAIISGVLQPPSGCRCPHGSTPVVVVVVTALLAETLAIAGAPAEEGSSQRTSSWLVPPSSSSPQLHHLSGQQNLGPCSTAASGCHGPSRLSPWGPRWPPHPPIPHAPCRLGSFVPSMLNRRREWRHGKCSMLLDRRVANNTFRVAA